MERNLSDLNSVSNQEKALWPLFKGETGENLARAYIFVGASLS